MSSSKHSTVISASQSVSISATCSPGFWTGLIGLAMIQSEVVAPAFGVIGLVLGPLFVICSLEFVGSFEARGWKVAAALVPITYIGWSLWLLAVGIALLAG